MKLYTKELIQELSGSALELAHRIESKEAVIGVVGLGYVGLPIALEFAKQGYLCHGVDVSQWKIDLLQQGDNFIEDLKDEEVADAVKSGLLKASSDYGVLAEADVIYICVPTPFTENKEPDLTFVISASTSVSKILRPNQLVILKSTTFPGTTEDYVIPALNASGLEAGKDYYVAFSPERVDPGNQTYHTANTPIVVGGTDEVSSILASQVNAKIISQIYMVNSPKVAELEKLLENIFRCVNIALVNELALLCERMGGIDVWEVIEAAATKPFGYMKFTPGPGVGGHCIPIDPYYLSWLARKYDFETKFITLSANVNESMPYHIVNQVIKVIAHQPIVLSDARVLVLGAAFKKNIRDTRNSPSEAIIMRLIENGIEHIDVSDPWVEDFKVGDRVFPSLGVSAEMLASYNCVILVTDHSAFDMDFIVAHSKHVIDTRNYTRNVKEGRDKISVLGNTAARPRLVTKH